MKIPKITSMSWAQGQDLGFRVQGLVGLNRKVEKEKGTLLANSSSINNAQCYSVISCRADSGNQSPIRKHVSTYTCCHLFATCVNMHQPHKEGKKTPPNILQMVNVLPCNIVKIRPIRYVGEKTHNFSYWLKESSEAQSHTVQYTCMLGLCTELIAELLLQNLYISAGLVLLNKWQSAVA